GRGARPTGTQCYATETALEVVATPAVCIDQVPYLALVDDERVVATPVAELAGHTVDQHPRSSLEPFFGSVSLEAHRSQSSGNHQSFRTRSRFQWTRRGLVKLSRPSGPSSLALPLARMPPSGAARLSTTGSLTQTVPTWSSRKARSTSREVREERLTPTP